MSLQNILLRVFAGAEELKFQFLADSVYARLRVNLDMASEQAQVKPGWSVCVWYVDSDKPVKEALGIYIYTGSGRQISFFAQDIDPLAALDSRSADLTRIVKVRQKE